MNNSIKQKSVTIQTLLLDDKKLSQSIFNQMPKLPSIFTDENKAELVGDVWGYVRHNHGVDYIVEVLGTLNRVEQVEGWDRVTNNEAVPHTQEAIASTSQGALGRGMTRAERDEKVAAMQQENAAAAESYQKVTDALVDGQVHVKPQLYI